MINVHDKIDLLYSLRKFNREGNVSFLSNLLSDKWVR